MFALAFLTMAQEIIISIFHLKKQHRWWAFKNMGLKTKFPKDSQIPFFKMMGTGADRGFSMFPNFSAYLMLCVFDSEEAALEFKQTEFYQSYLKNSIEYLELALTNIKVHGRWSGKTPFEEAAVEFTENTPIAVITRASIKPAQLWRFWFKVPKVAHDIKEKSLFAIGMGEIPLLEQATFSIWKNKAAMMDWAYQQKHKQVIKATKVHDWYSEELFSRFVITNVSGSFKGFDAAKLEAT